MAIGRISGPMLFSNLERQGLDLAIEGNLIYFDVNRRRIGVNTSDPQYDVHIEGWQGNTPTLYVSGNVKANVISVNNAYTFPVTDGTLGDVLTTDGSGVARWTNLSGAGRTIERKKFHRTIADLPAGGYTEFIMDIGISSIVYGLTVSRPCLVEVFSTELKNESNPYTFLATLDHLVDDGTVLMSDGSTIQQRQYSIFSNQEEPVKHQVYARVTNIDGVGGSVDVDLTYFAAVTDNAAGIYDMNLVDQLPTNGYTGQTVLHTPENKLYVWYNNVWNAVA
jgi:hypothetical protein